MTTAWVYSMPIPSLPARPASEGTATATRVVAIPSIHPPTPGPANQDRSLLPRQADSQQPGRLRGQERTEQARNNQSVDRLSDDFMRQSQMLQALQASMWKKCHPSPSETLEPDAPRSPQYGYMGGIQYPMRAHLWTHGSSGRPALTSSQLLPAKTVTQTPDARRQDLGSPKVTSYPKTACVRASRCQRPGPLDLPLHPLARWPSDCTGPDWTALACCLRQALPDSRSPLELPEGGPPTCSPVRRLRSSWTGFT